MLQSDLGRHFLQIAGSFVFFEWISAYVSPQIANYLPAYNNLTTVKKAEFHSRTCSSIHAVIVSVACLYILVTDEESKKDMVWGDSWLARSNIAISVGYLLSDLRYILKDIENSGGGWGYVWHHLSALWPYSLVVVLNTLSYFANFRLMAEISTPFVNFRWYYDVTGKKDSQAYFYNGLILTGTFFLFRIAVMPYYYYLVYLVSCTEDFAALGLFIQLSWIVPCIVLDVLNVLWFYKIIRGARKVLKKRKSALTNGTNISHSSNPHDNDLQDASRLKTE